MNDGVVTQASVPKSVSRTDIFQSLESSGVIKKEKAGRGFRYEIKDEIAYKNFYYKQFPAGDIEVTNEIESQLKYRNTKAEATEKDTIVFMRGSVDIEVNGQLITDLEYRTSQFGLHSSLLMSLKAKKICYVENLICFLNAEKLISSEYLFIHFYGRLPKESKLQRIECSEFLHWGDYDFVGLNEYLRAKSSFANTSTYIPEDFDTLFELYSTPRKEKDTIYSNVMECIEEEVVKVREKIRNSGRILEQQVLLEGKM